MAIGSSVRTLGALEMNAYPLVLRSPAPRPFLPFASPVPVLLLPLPTRYLSLSLFLPLTNFFRISNIDHVLLPIDARAPFRSDVRTCWAPQLPPSSIAYALFVIALVAEQQLQMYSKYSILHYQPMLNKLRAGEQLATY